MDHSTVDSRAIVDGAIFGKNCRIAPFAIVEPGAQVGDHCVLEPFARITSSAVVGSGCRIGQGAVVGCAPQHRDWSGQPAPCVLGNNVRIGEYCTLSGGFVDGGVTRIGDNAMIMAYAHVGHDAVVGAHAILANGVQLAGLVQVGDHAFLGGGAHVHQGTCIGDFAFVAGAIRLDHDLVPWSKAMGEPARWAGINRVALVRNGFASAEIAQLSEALRVLLRRGLLLSDALQSLQAKSDRFSAALVSFIEGGKRGLLRP